MSNQYNRFWPLLLGLATITLMIWTAPLHAQSADSTRDTTSTKAQHGIVGAPYIKYAPETGWVGGIVGLYYFHIASDTGRGSARPSSISGGAYYTQKHQYSIGLHPDLYLVNDVYHLSGGIAYKETPFDFYGDGDRSGTSPIDHYTPLWRGIDAKFTKNFERSSTGEGLNVGISGEIRSDEILSSDSGGILQSGQIPGAQGGLSTGLGLTANYDTRDNIYSTHEGVYAELDAMFYGRATGSSFTFNRYSLDLRKFIPLLESHVIAVQGLLTIAQGNEPFYTMAQLGGELNMRGYYQGRFRDNDMAVLQVEYRLPIWWRFGFVAFADAGEVAHTLHGFTATGLHYSFGPGIRFLVIPKQKLGVRLDYGIGNDSHELYLSILEAF